MQPFIVGRQAEVADFTALVEGNARHWLLNVYGPGGIGKTVVCQKLAAYARDKRLPVATVDGTDPDLRPERILAAVAEGLATDERLAGALGDFERQLGDYLLVQDLLQRGGGIAALFDVVGNVKDPAGFARLRDGASPPLSPSLQQTIGNRFALERYLRGAEKALAASLGGGLAAAVEQAGSPLALLIDTYEEMEGLDDWVFRTFVPALPRGVKVVVFGRNALPKVNFDWSELGDGLRATELPELAEEDAKQYLAHHGLSDTTARDQVHRFTGGYPLLLVLVVHLAREAGGWNQIGTLELEADRDRVAQELLKRILREERAREVRAFLEKGVVARWFNPEIVSLILEAGQDEGRAIYDKLGRHSFVERHPYGLKFHDKIRELLVARLKFTNAGEHRRLTARLMDYYAEKAGIEPGARAEDRRVEVTAGSSYTVHIASGQGIAIGDNARVFQSPGAAPPGGSEPAGGEESASMREVHQILNERLSLEELRTLCFHLGVDYEDLGGEGKSAKVRELILYLERRGTTARLIEWLREERKDIVLSAQLGGATPKPAEAVAPGRSRCADLAAHIHETLNLIKQYEERRLLSDDPREQRRAERAIGDLRGQLASFEAESQALGCKEGG